MVNRTEKVASSVEITPSSEIKQDINLSYTAIYGGKDSKLSNLYLRLERGEEQVFI